MDGGIDREIIFIEKMIEILKNQKFRLIQKFKKSKILPHIISCANFNLTLIFHIHKTDIIIVEDNGS